MIEMFLGFKKSKKPFVMWCTAMDKRDMEWVEIFEEKYNLSVYHSSEKAIEVLSVINQYRMKRTTFSSSLKKPS